MSLSSHSSLRLVLAAVFAVSAAACASSPTPPPAAAAPPGQAFQQASGKGVMEQQADDDVVFVPQDHKQATTHVDEAPATSLHADQPTARPKR